MDLYRYFHPHHNPRLRSTPLRLQELGELEQAATELRRAIQRAEIRAESSPVGEIRGDHFKELSEALDYVVTTLHTLGEAHPGDEMDTVHQMLEERATLPGWENWSRLVKQKLRGDSGITTLCASAAEDEDLVEQSEKVRFGS